jgi:methionine-rich copper-binding protein CopC
MRQTLFRFVCGFLVIAALNGPAKAHAFLDQASPRVGSRIAAAPRELRLWFSEPVEPAFCTVEITGPPGFGGAGRPAVAPGDRRILVTPLRGPTPPGRYRVHWRVVSVDSHVTQGDFQFEVAP